MRVAVLVRPMRARRVLDSGYPEDHNILWVPTLNVEATRVQSHGVNIAEGRFPGKSTGAGWPIRPGGIVRWVEARMETWESICLSCAFYRPPKARVGRALIQALA